MIEEALQGVLGNRGIRPLISGEQGNKHHKLKGTGDQRQFRGTENIENQDFDLREQGKMLIFFQGNKRTSTPPPPPPNTHTHTHTSPPLWEGLIEG